MKTLLVLLATTFAGVGVLWGLWPGNHAFADAARSESSNTPSELPRAASGDVRPGVGPRLNGRIPAWPYGVRGDGTTDSTAALQEAIDAANEGRDLLGDTGPRYVELPAGVVRTTRPIALKTGVILIGSGSGIFGDHAGPVIELTGTTGSGGWWLEGAGIENLTITGRGPAVAVHNENTPQLVKPTAGGTEFHWAVKPESFNCVLDGPAWPAQFGNGKGYRLEYWTKAGWKALETGDVSYSRRHLSLFWTSKNVADWVTINGLWPLRLRTDNAALRVLRGPWSAIPTMTFTIRDVQIHRTQTGIDLQGGYPQHCLVDDVTCRGLAGGMLHLMGNANVITRMDRESGVRAEWQRPLAEMVVVGSGNSLRDNIVEGHTQECLGYFCSGWGVEMAHNWLEGLKPHRGMTMLFEDCRGVRVDALYGGPGFQVGLAYVSGQVDNLGCYAGNPCRVSECFAFLPPWPDQSSLSVGLFMGAPGDPGDPRLMIHGRTHLQTLVPLRN